MGGRQPAARKQSAIHARLARPAIKRGDQRMRALKSRTQSRFVQHATARHINDQCAGAQLGERLGMQ